MIREDLSTQLPPAVVGSGGDGLKLLRDIIVIIRGIGDILLLLLLLVLVSSRDTLLLLLLLWM